MTPKVLPLVAYALLAACNGDKPGEWSLFVYPDAADHQKWQRTASASSSVAGSIGDSVTRRIPFQGDYHASSWPNDCGDSNRYSCLPLDAHASAE